MFLPATVVAQNSVPVPRVNPAGPALTFDFPGMRIGVAEYDEGPTGTTVFYFPGKVVAAVDVRGGAPGTIFTDALRLGIRERRVDGVVFSGGSAYGLAAATGAAAALKPQRVRDGQWGTAAWFPGAIIYDIGARRLSTVTPDEALGAAALNAAVEGRFPLGPRGAGRSAMEGYFFTDKSTGGRDWPHSGQGGAFRQIGPTKIAVFTVVNATGAVVDRNGRRVRCSYAPSTERLRHHSGRARTPSPAAEYSERRQRRRRSSQNPSGLSSNTTITLVVTNQKLEVRELQRLAIQVHMSMSRAIQPFSTTDDGDALFAVTTDEVDNPSLSALDLSTIASETAWDAVLASVPQQDPVRPIAPIRVPASDLDSVIGTYEFPSGTRVVVARDGDQLHTTVVGSGGIFFSPEGQYADTCRRTRVSHFRAASGSRVVRVGRRSRHDDDAQPRSVGSKGHRDSSMTAIGLREQLQATLGDCYSIERELGGGGMSRVFVARDVTLGRDVVVKVIAPESAEGLSAERFAREVKLAARLQQANIVPVLTAGTSGNLPYYTMPFVRGESLRARLDSGTEMSVAEAVNILRDVARALAYAHAEHVVHRDIKPENILLSGGAAVVTDFGIAKAIVASRTVDSGATTGITLAGVSLARRRTWRPSRHSAIPALINAPTSTRGA